jgi:hypothetical protein
MHRRGHLGCLDVGEKACVLGRARRLSSSADQLSMAADRFALYLQPMQQHILPTAPSQHKFVAARKLRFGMAGA